MDDGMEVVAGLAWPAARKVIPDSSRKWLESHLKRLDRTEPLQKVLRVDGDDGKSFLNFQTVSVQFSHVVRDGKTQTTFDCEKCSFSGQKELCAALLALLTLGKYR